MPGNVLEHGAALSAPQDCGPGIADLVTLVIHGINQRHQLLSSHQLLSTALEAGVAKAHIIDGRIAHSLMLEVYTDKGIGTEIVL